MKQTVINNNSIGPIGLLWVALIVLKLMEVIHWSWWIVVFFPILASLGTFAVVVGIAAFLGGCVWVGDKLLN